MKRLIACLLSLAMLAPTLASAAAAGAETALLASSAGGNEPVYVVLTPDQVAALGNRLAEYEGYPVLMGGEAALRHAMRPMEDMPVLGVPPLIWGLVLSLPGVIVVRLNSEERSATQKALLGAGINLVALTVLYFVVFSPVTKGDK